MPTIPDLDVSKKINHSPHVVILGAGASYAAFPKGDRNGLKLPLMNNLVCVLGLESVFSKHGIEYSGDNFEATYDALVCSGNYSELVHEIEMLVESYFSEMLLPDEVTIYDYLVLSLRPKDIIATFNWDPFLAQAFQRNMDVIGFKNMPQIAFLHGNVAIGLCVDCESKGWRYNTCDSCNKQLEQSKLLYPVSNKDYSKDKFIASEWERLQTYIKYSYFITIFGYSAPITDVEAKKMMLKVWNENTTRDLASINIIDRKSEEEIKSRWRDFNVRSNISTQKKFLDPYLGIHPRRSCDAYAMATLQQAPWQDNNFPRGKNLDELQNWVLQLVDEEIAGSHSGKPCK